MACFVAGGCSGAVTTLDGGHEDARASADASTISDAATADGGAAPDAQSHVVAFTSNRNGEYDIFTTDVNGAAPRQLTGGDGPDFHPAFSADGLKILFSGIRGRSSGLFEVALLTGVSTQIPTPGLVYASSPAVSPDGCCIAFEGVDVSGTPAHVYMMRMGQPPTRLTMGTARDVGPVFSRDSQTIFFVSDRENGQFHVFSMDLGGGNVTRETTMGGVIGRATVSPDGSKLVFARSDPMRRIGVIVELDRATGAERLISEENDFEPSYAPDGRSIVFASGRFGDPEIMLLVPGAMPRRITTSTAADGQPTLVR